MSSRLFFEENANVKIYILFLFLFSTLISFFLSLSIDQRGLNAALYLSEKIEFLEKDNILNLVYTNSYTSIYQLSEIILRLGFSQNFLNFILLFLSVIFNSIGIFFIVKSISKNSFFSIVISVLSIITTLNIGDLDYPVLILSDHTNGMIGSACVVLIFGLVGNKNYKLALLFCFMTITFHIVIGLWITLITIFVFLIFKKKIYFSIIKEKKNKFFIILIFFLISLSVFDFQLSKIKIPYDSDENLFTAYKLFWEHHRSNIIEINYIYIFISFLLFLSCLYMVRFDSENLQEQTILMIKLLLFHLLFSFIFYILFKVTPDIFNQKIYSTMPSRFFLLHSFLGLYILISFIYLRVISFDRFKNFFLIAMFFIFLLLSLFNSKSPILKNVYKQIILKEEIKNDKFWQKLKYQKFESGYFLSSVKTCSKVLKEIKQPLLFCPESIDYLNFIPSLIKPISEIMFDVYEINFFDPPEKNHGGLWFDNTYRYTFENRSLKDWVFISKKYNIKGLILPSDWELNLNKTLVGINYTYYKL